MSATMSKQIIVIIRTKGAMIFCLSMLLHFTTTASNSVSLVATLDTNQILIGDQVHLSLEVLRDKKISIAWPLLTKTVKADSGRELEILSSKLDTATQKS